jgi:outer membrane protein TolC
MNLPPKNLIATLVLLLVCGEQLSLQPQLSSLALSAPASSSGNPKVPAPAAQRAPAPTSSMPSGSPSTSGTIEYDESIVPDVSDAPPTNVVDSLNQALIDSPRAAAIRAQFGITEAGYAQVTVVPNPVFFFDRGLVAEQENRIGPILTEEPPWKLYFRWLTQKRLVDQTRFDLMTQLWQLRSDTRRAYTEIVVAQETLKTLNELYELSSKLEFVASKRYKAGDVPELDVLKARLATEQAATDKIVGAQRVIRARQQLNVLLGKPIDRPLNVPPLPDYTGGTGTKFNLQAQKSDVLPDPKESVPPLALFLSMAEDNRLELKSLNQQLKVNDANLKGAYGNMIPNPTIAVGKSYAGNLPTGPKITAVFFTINVQSPTSNFNQGNIVQYKATAKQLHYQIQSQKNQISAGVSSAYQTMLGARAKLFTYQDHILADSYETARLARRSYEVGQSDITATLAAQQANVQIRSQYLDAVSTYQQSFTDLEQACGTPLQ